MPGSQSQSYGSYPDYPEYEDPYEKEKMRGWVKGMDPSQVAGLALRPQAMIPVVAPELDPASAEYRQMNSLPVGSLALLSGSGEKKKGKFDGGPNDLGNQVGDIYDDLEAREAMPAREDVFRGLTGGTKGSYMREHFKDPAVPMGTATYEYQTLMNDALETYLPDIVANKYAQYGDYLLNRAAAKAMKRPAGKVNIARQTGRRLFAG